MSHDMLRVDALRGVLSPQLAELAIRLTGPDRQEWEKATEQFLRRKNPWDKPRVVVSFDRTIEVRGWGKFLMAEHFRAGSLHKPRAKEFFIRSVDKRIGELFNQEEEVPVSFCSTTLVRRWSLNYATRGTPLRTALEPARPQRMYFTHVWDILIRHMANKDSRLLNGEGENLFFVVDKHGKPWTLMLWPVPKEVMPNAWDVNLDPASHSDRHRAGSYVFAY